MAEELGFAKRVTLKVGPEQLVISVVKMLDKEKRERIFPHNTMISLSETIITYRPGFESMVTAIGLDMKKVDAAIPESFFDDYYNLFGEKPKAAWSTNSSFFGEPLYYNEVVERYKSLVINALMELPNAFV